jgi:hypothetical protein
VEAEAPVRCVVAVGAGVIVAVGALAGSRLADGGLVVSGVAIALGVLLPLLALFYALQRRRAALILLAVGVGLSVNVVYLANAVPANAATDNSSEFFLTSSTSYGCGSGISNMPQTNVDDNLSMPGGAGVNYFFCSDTFASTQSLAAGTITASVALTNSSNTKSCLYYGQLYWWHASTDTTTSLGQSTLQTLPPDILTKTTYTWTWSTSAVTFEDGDRLRFLYRFHSSGSNCSDSTLWGTTLAQPSKITVAVIVPEGIAGLLVLAPTLPIAAQWWKRRRQ